MNRTRWMGPMVWTLIPAVLALGAFGLAGTALAQDGPVLRGRVLDPNGHPVKGALVVVLPPGLETRTDAEGLFAIPLRRPGSYTLEVHGLGFRSLRRTVDVAAGADPVRLVVEPRAVTLEGLTVFGSPEERAEVQARLREIPGSVALIESAELRETRQANFHDVLRFTPGVYVQPRFGAADESQLSIRGSGLRNNFHLRGVNLLVNGMPYRNADGFTDFESLELLTADNIQVYKGANALRYGGSTLGGAINLETKTGYNAAPVQAFAQGGAYGFAKAQASSGAVLGNVDYYVSYARTQVNGYRAFADQERDRVNAHLGVVVSPKLDVRLFYFFAHVNEDLPGSLTREEFASDPRLANPTNVANRWGRDYTLHHVGLQLRSQITPTQRLEVAPYGQFRDIVHPIFRVLDQTSWDVGAEIRYENTAPLGERAHRLTVGFQPAFGRTDNRHFDNVGGEAGDLRKDQTDEAASLAFYAEDVFALTPRLSTVVGLRWDRSLRRVTDDFLDDGDQTDERYFTALLPKLGLIYDLPTVRGQIFANASRAFEPPLLLELNSFTVPGFIELDAQDAWQFEVGMRGEAAGLEWDVAVYDIELTDEIVNINVQPFPDAPFTVPTYRNVDRSRHVGVEAGVSYSAESVFARHGGGDRLGGRVAYTFARYEFVDDPDFDGNEIPGAPRHVIQAELSYRHPAGFTIRPNVEWVPGSYYVNSANTVRNDGWLVLGLRGEWRVRPLGATVFAEVRNLTDQSYSPAVNVDNAAGRFFQPADGRSLYAGVRWRP